MKWTKVSDYCIRSGEYRISLYVLGGRRLYEVYHGETLIGDSIDSNEARRIARRHKETAA